MTTPTVINIPDAVRETVLAEIKNRNFSATEIRWLIALLTDDPLIPAPTAAAMVARVTGQPLGSTLRAIEDFLDQLPDPSPNLLPAERKMTTVILQTVAARLKDILTQLDSGA